MRIQEALSHLLLKQPFYGYLAASLSPVESTSVPTISMTTVPAMRLLYNQEWYEALETEQALGAVIHELLHLVLLHPWRRGSRDVNLWLTACDMAVNEYIEPALLTAEAVTVIKIARETRTPLPAQKTAEFYYDFLDGLEQPLSFSDSPNEIRIVSKSGQMMKANRHKEEDSSEVTGSAMKSMLSDLLEQAREEGEIPGGIQAQISELYAAHEVNWRNILKRFLSGRGRIHSRKTCKKESRRFDNMPGNHRTVGVTALLALDESGSISDAQTGRFYNELRAIHRITGAHIQVTRFDTECTPPVPLESFTRKMEREKNGGTDFRPVFELADRLRIPLLIIFTDGEGTVPEESNQRVLWVLTQGGKRPAPYGHYVTFEA